MPDESSSPRSRWIPVGLDAFLPTSSRDMPSDIRPPRYGGEFRMENVELVLPSLLAFTPELDTARPPEPDFGPDGLDDFLWTVDGPERELLENMMEQAGRDDEEILLHSLRVGSLAERIALEMGCPAERAEILRRAAVLHDVGKLTIPEPILNKRGPLLEEELETSKLHTILGADLLDGGRLPVLRLAQLLALRHHERWDGTGYPDALVGPATPLMARIVAVADVFDALTHERTYKPAWTEAEAVVHLGAQRGRGHEPRIVNALFRVLERHGIRIPPRDGHTAA